MLEIEGSIALQFGRESKDDISHQIFICKHMKSGGFLLLSPCHDNQLQNRHNEVHVLHLPDPQKTLTLAAIGDRCYYSGNKAVLNGYIIQSIRCRRGRPILHVLQLPRYVQLVS